MSDTSPGGVSQDVPTPGAVSLLTQSDELAARFGAALDEAEQRLRSLVDAARRQNEPVLYLSMVLAELGYTIDTTLVSDFVYPAWFESFRLPGSTQFDKQGHVQEPFAILQGGYALVYDIGSGSGYHQVFGKIAPSSPQAQPGPWELNFRPTRRPRVGSRRERRMTHRQQWVRSAVHTKCGTERWPVKTLGDADVAKVAFDRPVTSSVLALRALPAPFPAGQSGPQDRRLAPPLPGQASGGYSSPWRAYLGGR